MTRQWRAALWLSGLAACLLGLACRTGLQNGVFSKSGVRYRVGAVPFGYRRAGVSDNDVALESKTGQSIAVNSTCRQYDDASLQVLTRHLVMGFTEVNFVDREQLPLDGRESLTLARVG